MVVNGQVFDAMGYELDGTTNQDPILGIIVINPTFDSVAEVKQAIQNFDAEFSYTGGGVASLLDQIRHQPIPRRCVRISAGEHPGFQDFARNPFTNANPVYRQNQFGGSIGGKSHQGQAVLLRRYAVEPPVAGRIRSDQRADGRRTAPGI